jgi:hypothetical protein
MARVLDSGQVRFSRNVRFIRRLRFTSIWMSSEPTLRQVAVPGPLVLKFVLAGLLSLAVVAIVPRTVSSTGDVPPVGMLLVTATIVGAICATLLFWGLRSDLGLPKTVAIYAVVFNVLVILVKLTLGPHGFYEVDQVEELDGTFAIDNTVMAVGAAALVFLLYVGVYIGLYRYFRAKVQHLSPRDSRLMKFSGRRAVIGIVVLTILCVATGGALLLLFFPLIGGLSYLDFVFSSSLSLLIAVILACATGIAAMTFSSAADRARVVGDASVFVSFFWVGLYFLALYHVLWVVYVLVLTAIWPLKVVNPK